MEAVHIALNKETSLSKIQEAFNTCYPFLKIEFFETAKDVKLLRSTKIDPTTTLRQLHYCGNVTTLNISNFRTVTELSLDFENVLGVIAQVSRKSGKTWNLISVTASWTLKSQNDAGEFICHEMGSI